MPPFSPTVMERFLNPRHRGCLARPAAEGWAGSVPAGRWMRLQVTVADGRITAACFATYGCVPAVAAADMLCSRLLGRTLAAAAAITPGALRRWLGGLPENRQFCADLAVAALQATLAMVAQQAVAAGDAPRDAGAAPGDAAEVAS